MMRGGPDLELPDRFDVAIIGGGPAGLSAALTLSRAGKRSVVFDAGRPRNSRSRAAHGYLTRDTTAPRDLRLIAREELDQYGLATSRDDRVLSINQHDSGFTVEASSGPAHVAYVILAAGVVDELPDIAGLAQHWGGAVIHCPFCQGWERRGRPWALLALTDGDLAAAPRMLAWTDELNLLVGHLDPAAAPSLDALMVPGIRVESGAIAAVGDGDEPDELAVRFHDGHTLAISALVLRPPQTLAPLITSLALATTPTGHVRTDETGETSRPGIYAVGDVAGKHQAVMVAAASGLVTAQAVSHRLTLDSLTRHGQRRAFVEPAGASPLRQ